MKQMNPGLLSAIGAATALVLGWAATAHAQACLLGPVRTPDLTGAPNWYGSPATTADKTGSFAKLGDPRWAGAPLSAFANAGGAGEAELRALAHGDHLYLSYHALGSYIDASGGIANPDYVVFGFSLGTAATDDAYLLRFDVSGVAAGTFAALSPAQVGHWDGSVWDADVPAPSWIEQVHVWGGGEADGVDWALNLKIKVKGAGGAGLGTGDIHVFHGMGWAFAVSDTEPTVVLGEYTTPDVTSYSGTFVDAFLHVPNSHVDWLTVKAPGTACTGGVRIEQYDIKTGHSDQRSLYTGTGSDPDVNTLIVRPKNVPSRLPSAQLDHTVRVRFSVADWGAQLANPASSAWNPVHGTETFGNSPGTFNWTWDNTEPSGPAAGATDDVTISFQCVKDTGQPFCPALANIPTTAAEKLQARHQCMLAELRGDPNHANSSHISFETAATYNNLDFVQLSTFERDATISIKGLKQLTGKDIPRDVYLHVKKRNLPQHGPEKRVLPARQMKALQAFAMNPPHQELNRSQPSPADLRREAEANKGKEGRQLPSDVPLRESSLSRTEILGSAWPSYQVHAYYDTGLTRKVGGVATKILRPLVPFGYFLNHDGPFYGFSDSIEGLDGAVLEQLSENFYKVTIPSEGKILIKTKVTAEEMPPGAKCDCSCCKGGKVGPHKHSADDLLELPPHHHGCGCSVPGQTAPGWLGLSCAALLGLVAWRRRAWR